MGKYQLIEKAITIEEKSYTTYGIKYGSEAIHDISTDKSFVESIIEALNKSDVAKVHLTDIVEDFLAT